MATSNLVLRPLATVCLALAVAPLIALTGYWLMIEVLVLRGETFQLTTAVVDWVWVLIIGGIICWLVELAFVVPLLVGFHRYRWRWLNGWSGAAIGFLFGFLFSFCFSLMPVSPGYSSSGQYGVVYVDNGVVTAAGWEQAFLTSSAIGGIGLVGAVLFRLIAVRRVGLTKTPPDT